MEYGLEWCRASARIELSMLHGDYDDDNDTESNALAMLGPRRQQSAV